MSTFEEFSDHVLRRLKCFEAGQQMQLAMFSALAAVHPNPDAVKAAFLAQAELLLAGWLHQGVDDEFVGAGEDHRDALLRAVEAAIAQRGSVPG